MSYIPQIPERLCVRNVGVSRRIVGGLGCAALCVVLNGCGGGNGFFAQPQKSYVVVVTVATGSLSHSTNVTLTVQ